jgi:hypothetical protein
MIDFANWLVDNYDGGDTRAAYILDNATVYILPIANPDGYAYNMPNGGMHRKNMNYTLGDGVDLNRNWGYEWGHDDYGSSPNPNDETYRGTAPFSEPETQVQSNFMIDVQPIVSMSYHTYGGDLLYPWGYENSPTPDDALFQSWASAMTADNGYEYGRCGQVLGYTSNGDQMDWTYCGEDMPKTICMTPEVGDNGFWGSQNDTTEIVRICNECRPMNILFCMLALNYVGIGDQEQEMLAPPVLSLNTITPNPAMTSVQFGVTSPASSGVKITVYDTSGRVVQSIPVTGSEGGSTTMMWAVPSDLPAGVYTASVSDASGNSDSRRFTVIR